MRNSVTFEISGKEGIFNQTNTKTIYWAHENEQTVKEIIQAIIKQAKKMNNAGETTIDLGSMDSTYHIDWKYRYIIRSAAWRDNFEVEVRKNINNSFPSVEPFHFVSQADLFKYLKKHITEQTFYILPAMPSKDEKSYYSQKLDGTLLDVNMMLELEA